MTVLGVVEHRRGDIRDVSYELVTAGRELASANGEDFSIAIISGDTDRFADDMNVQGVDTIYTIDTGDEYNHGVYTQALVQLHADLEPSVILMPHSVNGLDYAPALAAKLDLPLLTDVLDIDPAGEGFSISRELYGGKVGTTYEVDSQQIALTIRPAEWPAAEKADGDAHIEAFEAEIDNESIGIDVSGYEEVAGGDIDITQSDVLVSIGRGIEEEENLPLVEALAESLDAVLSSSRPIVDSGWLPPNRQVGQSGKTVTPDIYIAIGISGAVQHVSGMKGSDTIIAINNDPDAPIFDIADYGIVGDLFDVVPALIEEFGGNVPSSD